MIKDIFDLVNDKIQKQVGALVLVLLDCTCFGFGTGNKGLTQP
jgi:hypothetical protein